MSVSIKDSKIGASTDANGVYKITIPAKGATLIFTYVGDKWYRIHCL
ncbi:carboxypeptidase-like regulatory domain-containing protein [Pedobacter borealis]